MFESLSNRLQDVFRNIRGEGRLTEETMDELRMASGRERIAVQ